VHAMYHDPQKCRQHDVLLCDHNVAAAAAPDPTPVSTLTLLYTDVTPSTNMTYGVRGSRYGISADIVERYLDSAEGMADRSVRPVLTRPVPPHELDHCASALKPAHASHSGLVSMHQACHIVILVPSAHSSSIL
jgi:hypothetical protein